MNRTLSKIIPWIIGIWLAGCFPAFSFAENHALLIGIGNYSHMRLEGPTHDVQALSQTLSAHYGFKKKNVRTLINEQAVKSRILEELRRLVRISRPGDHVFIYFSGHGTSRRDALLSLPLPYTSGALVPADFNWNPDQTIEKQISQLIVGKRDLQPILTKLDRDRQVLVVFDTCFSGNTVRGMQTVAEDRYFPLGSRNIFEAEQRIGGFSDNLKSNAPYPYQNTFYISAATENETARDIRTDLLDVYPTIDGNPHGALTDSLLRVLTGQTPVDADNDGRWSQIELYRAVRSDVRRRFRQTPQALPREGKNTARLYDRVFFARPAAGIASAVQKPPGRSLELPAKGYRQGYSASYALVIGIDKYRHWPHLEYAAKDAREIAALLQAKGFQTRLLIDEKATRSNIVDNLERITQAADANSRVVIYFGGHGRTEDLPGGGERGWLVPADGDRRRWRQTMLAMNLLNQKVRQIRAKHVFLAFDACYSGLGLARSINFSAEQEPAYIREMMRSRSVQILTAGSRSEPALESDGHGLFTQHLLAALAGTADINNDGYITATEIYATVRPGVARDSEGRQTPQFGYIEGNGDIVFYNTPGKAESAWLTIDSGIDGIDVWVGNARIGSRLPSGRHRQTVAAGPTTILVKKDDRTLYRRTVTLVPGGEVAIRLTDDPGITPGRRPFSMLTVAHPAIDNYADALARDLDGDGQEELVVAGGNRLVALKSDSSLLWQKQFDFPIRLDLVDEWDGCPAIGLSAIKPESGRLLLLNGRGEIIWQNYSRSAGNLPSGAPIRAKIARLADIDRDGLQDVVAIATGNPAATFRGVIVYDRFGRELWRAATGSQPQNIAVWPGENRRPDIVIGTFSSDAAMARLQKGFEDRQAAVISIDGYGRTNWVVVLGSYYTGVRVVLPDLKADENRSLYAYKFTAYNFRDDKGGIYKISRAGDILQRFENDSSILDIAADSHGRDTGRHLYALDKKGNLFELNDRLKLLHQKSMKVRADSTEIRLVGVHDYDGDGDADILLYSFDRLFYTRNPLADAEPQRKMFYSHLGFQILSHDFSTPIKKVSVAEKWEKRGAYIVKDLDRPDNALQAFMVLGDKIAVYNY